MSYNLTFSTTGTNTNPFTLKCWEVRRKKGGDKGYSAVTARLAVGICYGTECSAGVDPVLWDFQILRLV